MGTDDSPLRASSRRGMPADSSLLLTVYPLKFWDGFKPTTTSRKNMIFQVYYSSFHYSFCSIRYSHLQSNDTNPEPSRGSPGLISYMVKGVSKKS